MKLLTLVVIVLMIAACYYLLDNIDRIAVA